MEATSTLWVGVSLPKRELIRSFLNVINLEVVKRLRPSSRFDWSGASIGNLFLTGWVLSWESDRVGWMLTSGG